MSQLAFSTYQVADVSTAHITQRDAEILDHAGTPGHLASLDTLHGESGAPGFIISVLAGNDHTERMKAYEALGLSQAFKNLIDELSRQGIPYVRFDRDGDEVTGAPTFDW